MMSKESQKKRNPILSRLSSIAVMLLIPIALILIMGDIISIPGLYVSGLTVYISDYNSRFTIDGKNELLEPSGSASGDELSQVLTGRDVILSYPSYESLKSKGYHISSSVFNPSEAAIAFSDAGSFEAADAPLTSDGKPILEPFQGLIICRTEDRETVFDTSGKEIFNTSDSEYKLVGQRDRDGKAVIKKGDKYYIYDTSEKALKESDYLPYRDARPISGSYPAYYATASGELYRAYSNETGGWGFTSDTDFVVKPKYHAAYTFREGMGVTSDKDGRIYVFRADGTRLFEGEELYLPETSGTESMGYFVFDNGIMLAREKISGGEKETFKTVALKKNGSHLTLPADYNILSYSDGVFLLEKNGKYGYFSYTGKWICDPVLNEARPFSEGLAVIKTESGYGMIDRSGRTVIPQAFEYISDTGNGVISLYDKSSGWALAYKLKAS